jgi:LPXTG-site transpeptidase (sortase) family protein
VRHKFSLLILINSLICFFVAGYLIWQRYAPIPATASVPTTAPSAAIRLSLPDLNIDLPVFPAKITGTRWEYTAQGVSHLSTTPWPGENGNAVFYGHNWPNLLGRLKNVERGQKIHIVTANHLTLTYQVSRVDIVSANNIQIIQPTPNNQLTLFTCTGFLDQKRLVVVATPVL